MIEAKFEGMKCQTSQRIHFTSVAFVSDYRMSQRLHVYADLVLAAGFQLEFHQ